MHPIWTRTRLWLFGLTAFTALVVTLLGGDQVSIFAAKQAGPPPQFTDPVTGKVDPNIVSETHDELGTHVKYKSGAIITNGSQTNYLPTPTKKGSASPDWIAFVKNGCKPVLTPLSQMMQSTTGITTEISPNEWIGACVSPPTGFNLGTATAAELAEYGLPPLDKGMTRAQYAQKYGSAKTHVCDIRATNGPSHRPQGLENAQQAKAVQIRQHTQKMAGNLSPMTAQRPLTWHGPNRVTNTIWEGNVADQDSCSTGYGYTGLGCSAETPYVYTEADMDYVWPGASCTTTYSAESMWVGLGGTATFDELTQVGTQNACVYGVQQAGMWIEYTNTGCGTPGFNQYLCEGPETVGFTGTTPGDKVWVKVKSPNNYYWGDVTHQWYSSAINHGPQTGESTAEFIVEKQGDGLPNFGSVTFDGIGVTELNLGYIPMTSAEHDYMVAYTGSDQLMNIGSLLGSSDPPGDKNQIVWLRAT